MDGPDHTEQTPFEQHAALWTGLAEQSPFWAILSRPGAEEASWDSEAFFRDGRAFADLIALHLQNLELVPAKDRALDFGCGLGRLTQAMATYFDRVDGVDVALPMIEGARRYNPHGSRCQFHHNTRLDLEFLEDSSFDFVLSALVLQHMRPEFMKAYIREFFRVLRPGGIAFFQLPICPILPDSARMQGPMPVELDGLRDGGLKAFPVSLRIRPRLNGVFASSIRDVQAVLRNDSEASLPPFGRIRTRFLSEDAMTVLEGTEAFVDVCTVVEPWAAEVTAVTVVAPGKPGKYVVEATVESRRPNVQLQCEPVRMEVHVLEPDPAQGNDLDPRTIWRADHVERVIPQQGGIEMYDLPLAEVLGTIEEAGGDLVHWEEDDWGGPSFVSAHFTASKRSRA